VFLNDWSCATEVNKETEFCGALHLAPDSVLQHLCLSPSSFYTPVPEHDLEMVVKAIFSQLFPIRFIEIANERDPAKLLAFWKQQLSLPIWQPLLDAARATQYKKLKRQIKKIML
jgi:hypothetical protein